MCPYSTPEDVWRLCGFSSVEADAEELSYYIYKANIRVIRDITARRKNAILLAGPESHIYYTWNYPIADVNGDGTVNTSDVQVYKWTNRHDEETKTGVTVSQVDWLTGRIVLAEDPGTIDVITADYAYYPNEIDWELIKDAEAYLAGYLFAIKKWIHIPEWLKIGTTTTRQAVKPYVHLYREYKQCMNLLKTRKWRKGISLPITIPDRKRIDEMVEAEEEELVFPG